MAERIRIAGDPRSPMPERYTGQPVDYLFKGFKDLSDHYPQNLVGISSQVGLIALDLIQNGQMTWEEFVSSELQGKPLKKVVTHTKRRHLKVGMTRNDRLSGILPIVYRQTKDSIISSISELAKGELGISFERVTETGIDDIETARNFLFDGDQSEANLSLVSSLFQATAGVLNGKNALSVSKEYRESLLGNSSNTFPASVTEKAEKKNILTEKIRQLSLPVVRILGRERGLSEHQVRTFVYNITRP